MATKPWYHAGLKFQCTQCGDCCTGAPGYVWVNKEEIEALAALLKLDVEEFEKRYVRRVGIRKSLVEFPNGDCIFFHSESRTCQVYQARPRQCRTWPFWNSNLASPEAWQRQPTLPRLQSRQTGHAGKNRGAAEDIDAIKPAYRVCRGKHHHRPHNRIRPTL